MWGRKRGEMLQRLEQDISAHIEQEITDNVERGMSPEEARSAALRKFGNLTQVKENSREVWGWLWLERFLQDVRYALRSLKNVPGFTTTVVLTLALGLGSVTAMLAIVHSVLIRPLALPYPEQLMLISVRDQQRGAIHELSYQQIETLCRSAQSFTAIGGYNTMVRPVGASDGTRVALLTDVTPQFFRMLGVHAELGRLFAEDEKAPVAVVSAIFWRERLHSNPKAVGSTLQLSGRLHTIIGVLPTGVRFPQGTEAAVVYTPVSLNAKGEDQFLADSAITMARVKPSLSKEQVLAEARSILHHSQESGRSSGTLILRSYAEYLTGNLQMPLLMLLGGAGVLLMVAFANATNLQIVRMTGRLSEMTVRSALGASFGRLLQQLATENTLLSLLGATLGAGMAYFLLASVRRAYGTEFPRFDELTFDPTILGANALLALIVGLLVSLTAALIVRRRINLVKTPTNRVTHRSRVPGLLVALQIALTCVLLVIGGLFIRTLRALQDVPLGFDPHGVTTLVLMPENLHKDPELSRQTDARLLERFEKLPGVQSATLQTALPFSNYNSFLNGTAEVDGRTFQKGDTAFYSMVSSNFVRASGIRLLRGRSFVPADKAGAAIVALVNQAFVQKYLPQREPIGTSIRFHRNPGETDADLPFTQPLTIVGVVENESQGGNLGAPYEPMVYMNYLQLPKNSPLADVFNFSAQFAVRSTLPQATVNRELRAAVQQIAPDMVEMNLQPMKEGISQSLGTRRLALRLVAGFAALALVLSAIGIYGVLAYAVALRRKEIGVRMALGSSRIRVVQLIAGQAGRMVLCGLIPGTIGAWIAGAAVKSLLFGVSTVDPGTYGAMAGLLLVVCAIAATAPAWEATRIEPIETLRME